MKKSIFDEQTNKVLKKWQKNAQKKSKHEQSSHNSKTSKQDGTDSQHATNVFASVEVQGKNNDLLTGPWLWWLALNVGEDIEKMLEVTDTIEAKTFNLFPSLWQYVDINMKYLHFGKLQLINLAWNWVCCNFKDMETVIQSHKLTSA